MAKVLYGALFIVVLPFLLVLWTHAAEKNITLPAYGNSLLGVCLTLCGLVAMLVPMWQLWRLGGGLPMNAFPPQNYVSSGLFTYFPHPIYTGFVSACLGVSMLAASKAGLWLVTPVMALCCASLVVGYERIDIRKRFGANTHLLPADEQSPPTQQERFRFLVLAVIPWVLLYEFTARLNIPGHAFGFNMESRFAIYGWTILIYESVYLTVVLAPWCARSRHQLRQLMLSAWAATALVFPVYWFMPSAAPRRTLTDTYWLLGLLSFERIYPPIAALPSFHTLWAIIVARLYRPKWFGALYATVVAISCITTGMHYILDVIAAVAIAPVVLYPKQIWRLILNLLEHIGNSWSEVRLGRVRIINHSLYAAAAGFTQVGIMSAALPKQDAWKALAAAVISLVGAGAWAQWVEGSSLLRRPFGFYGGLIGAAIGCLIFKERWLLLGACCMAAPWMQAIGRLRCLVNGCCHGSPTSAALGIRVVHPCSRITRLALLTGVPIHPTQLYSVLSNCFLGLLLWTMWTHRCPLSLICGVYGIGNGIARFAEEAYRGEPQTSIHFGLRLYQWLALACVVTGAALTALPAPLPPQLEPSLQGFACGIAFAILSSMTMSVDLPESNRPLSRLT